MYKADLEQLQIGNSNIQWFNQCYFGYENLFTSTSSLVLRSPF